MKRRYEASFSIRDAINLAPHPWFSLEQQLSHIAFDEAITRDRKNFDKIQDGTYQFSNSLDTIFITIDYKE